jgi:hypothetical protein
MYLVCGGLVCSQAQIPQHSAPSVEIEFTTNDCVRPVGSAGVQQAVISCATPADDPDGGECPIHSFERRQTESHINLNELNVELFFSLGR